MNDYKDILEEVIVDIVETYVAVELYREYPLQEFVKMEVETFSRPQKDVLETYFFTIEEAVYTLSVLCKDYYAEHYPQHYCKHYD